MNELITEADAQPTPAEVSLGKPTSGKPAPDHDVMPLYHALSRVENRYLDAALLAKGGMKEVFLVYDVRTARAVTMAKPLASPRRLKNCRWSEMALRQHLNRQRIAYDPLSAYPCLNGFAIFTGDGHYHERATHDLARLGHDTATQHFYALDLRTHAMRHVTAATIGLETDKAGVTSIRHDALGH